MTRSLVKAKRAEGQIGGVNENLKEEERGLLVAIPPVAAKVSVNDSCKRIIRHSLYLECPTG